MTLFLLDNFFYIIRQVFFFLYVIFGNLDVFDDGIFENHDGTFLVV